MANKTTVTVFNLGHSIGRLTKTDSFDSKDDQYSLEIVTPESIKLLEQGPVAQPSRSVYLGGKQSLEYLKDQLTEILCKPKRGEELQ